MPEQEQPQIDTEARIRVLEGKYNALRERLLITNQNMISEYKKLIQDIKQTNEEVKEIKKDLYDIKEISRHIVEEMQLFAKKDSLRVLEKYINMWNPLNFVTEQEVRRIIEEKKDGNKHKKE
jgi:hypothetical protein